MIKKNSTIIIMILMIFSYGCTANNGDNTLSHDEDVKPAEKSFQTPADVLFVQAKESMDGSWTFSVTIKHEDVGWEDYVNGWDIVLENGLVINNDPGSSFTRELLHPHVEEQPFTRSQSNITIPKGEHILIIRAHDLIEGYSGKEVTIDLTKAAGENFEIIKYEK